MDGNNILWRLAAKMPPLSTSSGDRVELVYGVFRVLHSALIDFEPDNFLMVWDNGIPRLRIMIDENYKRIRREKKLHKTREEKEKFANVMTQMEMIKDVLPYLSVCQYEVVDTEGDDLIAIACRCLEGKKVVVSGDKDMLQLVDKKVKVYLPLGKTRELYTAENFVEKVGLTPDQFLDVKILWGDKGDQVAGIAKGFGEESAIKLVKQYGSIENIWRHEKEISKMGKRFELIFTEETAEAVHRNRLLVDLKTFESKSAADAIRRRIAFNPKCDELKVRAYFRDHEFKSLIKVFHSWILPFKNLGGH
jgi:DNA polymerase-1